MTEATLKAGLKKRIVTRLPDAVAEPLSDRKFGIPDMPVTWNGHTTWFELKLYVGKKLKSNVQTLTAMKLAVAGRCRYVIYYDFKGEQWTLIVDPRRVHDGTWRDTYELITKGINHDFVVDYIEATHGDQRPQSLFSVPHDTEGT